MTAGSLDPRSRAGPALRCRLEARLSRSHEELGRTPVQRRAHDPPRSRASAVTAAIGGGYIENRFAIFGDRERPASLQDFLAPYIENSRENDSP
jgi:hypothetical protein